VAVRAATRHPGSPRLPAGVEVVPADLADPGSLAVHLEGVDSLFLLWPFISPEAAADLAPIVVKTIAQHVGRIVYLSARLPQSSRIRSGRRSNASSRRPGRPGRSCAPPALQPTRSCGRIRSVQGTLSVGRAARRPDPSSTSATQFVRRPELVTTTVQEVTGVPARSFEALAADHAGDFSEVGILSRL
jgi:hypothetical protein